MSDHHTKHSPTELLNRNRNWAAKKLEQDQNFFSRLSALQKPNYLWIGCSDSRVPANEIIGLDPGEIFVHRNIANVVPHTDMNCLSVIEYAVNMLKIQHIIVTGHYGCGGVFAAMGNEYHGQLDNWLCNIKDIYKTHDQELNAIKNETDRGNRLCELNVITQVHNVARTSIVQQAWKEKRSLQIHGWIYSLEDGLLRDLNATITHQNDLHDAFKLDLSAQ